MKIAVAWSEVVLAHHRDRLEIEVRDRGDGADGPEPHGDDGRDRHHEPGHGVVHMRERAALFGGHLDVGPRPGGGWRVHAVLPLVATSAGPTSAGLTSAAPTGATAAATPDGSAPSATGTSSAVTA